MNVWVVVTFCDAARYLGRCLTSIIAQDYRAFRCVIYDDCSADGSADVIASIIKDDPRLELVVNHHKRWQAGNWLHFVGRADVADSDVVIAADGDDWLPDSQVLDRVVAAYRSAATLVTYGNFAYWRDGAIVETGYCRPLSSARAIRSLPWVTSALRTFRAMLLRRVDTEDFRWRGETIPSAADHASMFAMIEMAGDERYRCLGDVNYIYNISNPTNTFKVRRDATREIVAHLRSLAPYPLLCDGCAARALGVGLGPAERCSCEPRPTGSTPDS